MVELELITCLVLSSSSLLIRHALPIVVKANTALIVSVPCLKPFGDSVPVESSLNQGHTLQHWTIRLPRLSGLPPPSCTHHLAPAMPEFLGLALWSPGSLAQASFSPGNRPDSSLDWWGASLRLCTHTRDFLENTNPLSRSGSSARW